MLVLSDGQSLRLRESISSMWSGVCTPTLCNYHPGPGLSLDALAGLFPDGSCQQIGVWVITHGGLVGAIEPKLHKVVNFLVFKKVSWIASPRYV